MIDLSNDKDVLLKLYKKNKHYKERDRYHALSLIATGKSIKEVADIFFIDEDTVRNWIDRWLAERNLSDKPKSGKPREIDENLERRIIELMDENNPGKYGMNCSFWDCLELQKFFAMYRIRVSRETIRRILKKNGFRYVKADYEYTSADKEEIADFLENFKEIMENREKGSSILFTDEMGTLLHPKKGYTWTRDKKALVKTHSLHDKVSALSVVNPLTGNSESMLTLKEVKKEVFVEFLERVYKKFRGTIYFFLDKSRPHKSNLVREFAEMHPRMKLIFLPGYSPQLNPVEQKWNYSRRKFLNNRVFMSVRSLMSSLSWFLRKLENTTIKSVCNIDILLNRIT